MAGMLDDETPLMDSQGRDGGASTGRPTHSPKPPTMLLAFRACVAEFVGVILFVFLGILSGNSAGGGLVSVAMAHGFTIALLIMAFGELSGGHFNPCVTLGAMLGGGISFGRSAFYLVSQLSGSVVGAALSKAVLPDEIYRNMTGGIPSLGSGDVTIWQGILCEAALTFLLVMTVLMTAVDRNDNLLAPLAIGLVVAVDISAAGPITGAVMNPARAFGPSVVGTIYFHNQAWKDHYVYWVGPVIGSLVASFIYRFILASTGKRLLCRDRR